MCRFSTAKNRADPSGVLGPASVVVKSLFLTGSRLQLPTILGGATFSRLQTAGMMLIVRMHRRCIWLSVGTFVG